MENHAIVVGAGFFGCHVALTLRAQGFSVTLIEREKEGLRRASYFNQARVHGGYHYPRSLLTGARSQANYSRFLESYSDCVDSSVTSYYAISKKSSQVTARQFEVFCRAIGAPIRDAPLSFRKHFNPTLIEKVFEVEECVFDASKVRTKLKDRVEASGIHWRGETEVLRVRKSMASQPNRLEVDVREAKGSDEETLGAQSVYLCTYADLNHILRASSLPLIPLQYELTEVALVEPPPELRGVGLTVMCGPFFSILPFPDRGLYSMTHVRYTPHTRWNEGDESRHQDAERARFTAVSRFLEMERDAERYFSAIRSCRYEESFFEIKVVLPGADSNDGRPILYQRDHGLPGLCCIVGGKIDNIHDLNHVLTRDLDLQQRRAG